MNTLVITFLKIFFRNHRAIFFVIVLPVGLFLILAFLRVEQVIQFNSNMSYTDFLLPGIASLAITQMGIYTVTYSLIDFKRQMVLKRLAVTPLSAAQFLQAQGMARFIVALLQTILLLGVSAALFQTTFNLHLLVLPLVILAGCLLFLNFGYILSSFADDYEEASPYTTMAGLSLGTLGDVFFPVSNLPIVFQKIAEILPMKPMVTLMRYSMFGLKPEEITRSAVALLIWLAVTTVVANAVFVKKAYK